MRVLSLSKTVKMLYIAPGECIPRDGNDVAGRGNDCAIFVKSAQNTGGDLPSVLGVENTLSKRYRKKCGYFRKSNGDERRGSGDVSTKYNEDSSPLER